MLRSCTSHIQSVLAPDWFSLEERRKKTAGMLCETATTKTSTSCRAIFVLYKDHEYALSLSLVIAAEEYWNIKGTLLTVPLMYSEAGEM